jgi:hypothetical protein
MTSYLRDSTDIAFGDLGKRVIPATFNPESYKYAITESLCAIKAKAEHLISQADMSAKYETRNGLQMVLDRELKIPMTC